MEKVVYNKLVRNRIPEIIAGQGKTVVTRVLDEDEYRTNLRDKLDEKSKISMRRAM